MGTHPLTESLCSRCARVSKTCCWGREIYITPADVTRIETVAHGRDFMQWCAPADPAYLEQTDDPLWERCVFRRDGTRRILKRSAAGACTFLGPAGCLLPEATRPLVCRLHPYTYTASGIDADPAPDCPRHLLTEGMTLFEALHMSTGQAMVWHRMLYEEILKENDDENRTDL